LYLPQGVTANTYYQYGPTAPNGPSHWYEFLYDGRTGAEILPDRIVLHFIDGQRGDGDLVANGQVVDPGSPAFDPARAPHDTTPPVLTLPADVTVEATGPGGAVVHYGAASATDDVTANPVIGYSVPNDTLFALGVTKVTVT